MAYCSLAHKPRSMSLQRSQQKGLKALLVENSDSLLHLGQGTNLFLEVVIVISINLNRLDVIFYAVKLK
jgi:hypothetical protein